MREGVCGETNDMERAGSGQGSISWSRDAAESLRHGLGPVGPQESSSTVQSLLKALSLRWKGLRSPCAEHQCHHPSLENTGTTLIQARGWEPKGITPGQLSSVRGCLGWAKGHQLVLKCRPVLGAAWAAFTHLPLKNVPCDFVLIFSWEVTG